MAYTFYEKDSENGYELAHNDESQTIIITQGDDPLLSKAVNNMTPLQLISADYVEITAYKFMKGMLRIGSVPNRPPA